jgi:CRISPR-associated protein Csm4
MRTFRVRTRFTSDSGTPLHSDTIFGHLCWVYRYQNGEDALGKDILKDYDTQPTVVVSDGFPSGYFPFPCLPPVPEDLGTSLFKEFFPDGSKEDFLPFLSLMKRVRKTDWIEDIELNETAQDLTAQGLARSLLLSEIKKGGKIKTAQVPKDATLVSHNTINRITGMVEKEGGGFFHATENRTRGMVYDIYVRTSLEWSEKDVEGLFFLMGTWGYGRDRSTGKGQFLVEDVAEFSLPEHGNAVIALSHFIPDESLSDGYYFVETKYGKLGGSYSQGAVAFPKTPIVMLKPGAIFKVNEKKAVYGQSVGPVHPELTNVRQQTYLLPYFVNLGVEENE